MSQKPNHPHPEGVTQQVFRPEDWLTGSNYRDIVHIDRDTILSAVRSRLESLIPQLIINGGVCFYRSYADDAEYSVLVTDHYSVAEPGSTVVSVNKIRAPFHTEPHFPNGRVIELLDLILPATTRWQNNSAETMYRHPNDRSWNIPKYSTLLRPKFNTLQVIGNLAQKNFKPSPPPNMRAVVTDATTLWEAHRALTYCSSSTLEPAITEIELTKN